ncbi:TonB-dependent receptor [Hymenobacter koreensis]
MKQVRLRHLLALLLTLLSVQQGWSQGVTTSSMSGVITDKAGEGLPGATVIAVHTPTNSQYVAPTNADGRYNIQAMRVGGPYTVRVTFVGYQEAVREGIFLSLGQNLRLDVNLSETTQTLAGVEVQGRRSPIINADRTGAATNIQREQIERLPTLSRSFNDFTRLTPQSNGGQSFGGRNGNFNNVTVDGALFNNAFGLSSTVGGQTNSQPISLDAIEEIQVNIAPYDVRQGSFTGAGINAVTRSGTNKFSGSAYAFRRNNNLIADEVRDTKQPFAAFSLWQVGARVGGPIIKDKLFFFVNAEAERRDDPPGNFVPSRPGQNTPGAGVSTARADELSVLSNFLQTNYGYNTGPFENYQLETYSDKLTTKIDWNITPKNVFSFKYNYLKSFRDVPPSPSGAPAGGRNPSATNLPYLAAFYRINNNLNSFIGELNSTISGRLSNTFQAGYTAFRDSRESSGGLFPTVDIENGGGQAFTSFGYEPFSANNILNTDVTQISDNLTYSAGKHVLTVGTYNEFYKFRNGFAPNYFGRYRFRNLTDFYSAAVTPDAPFGFIYDPATLALTRRNAALPPTAPNPIFDYEVRYSALPDRSFPFADVRAYQLGFYAQDEFSVLPNLKITAGVRADIPVINTEVERNETAANLEFRDGVRLYTDRLPKTNVLFSPRIGFNWDVKDDQKTQLRGGTGIFTGRVPYVWISNQASNNGVQFGTYRSTTVPGGGRVVFSPNVDASGDRANPNLPANATASTNYNLAVTEETFKFPQVFRSNLAIDQRLPGDVVMTLEGIYTKDLNAVYHQNVNLPNPSATAAGADNRPLFRDPAALNTRINQIYRGQPVPGTTTGERYPNISDAILMRNTNKGYSYTLTAQFQKTFDNGVSASLAYNYADARSVNDGGSIANSIWRDRQVPGDPNSEELSYSQFLQQHRIVGSASYRREYLGHLATTLSAFIDAGPGFRTSYTYNGDLNGDNNLNNDLIYVPRDQSEIVLTDIAFFSGTPQAFTYTKEQQWADLNRFIDQDKYLRTRRGQYAERNGAVSPWVGFIDARLLQDVFTNIGENRNSLQFSVDVFNVANLINKNWGVSQSTYRTGLLQFQDFDTRATVGGAPNPDLNKPRFTYPYFNNPTRNASTGEVTQGEPLTESFRYSTGEGSRWRIQLGLRYIFN